MKRKFALMVIAFEVARLTVQAADITAKISNFINSTTALCNRRIARNKTLYQPKTGLYAAAQEVKKYVKSVFGATSPEYKQVSKIKFTKLGK